MAEDQSTKQDFVDAGEQDAQKVLGKLTDQAHRGALFSDWTRQYCTRELVKWLDEQIQDTKNMWLSQESREKAEAIRLQAQSYTKIKNWILSQVKAGEVAAEGVKRFHEEGIELAGLIKQPPPPAQ
jgi:hypothetical protein